MNAREWVEKSRQRILAEDFEPVPFASLEDELKELHLELTYACNLKCRMCDIWGRYAQDRDLHGREMSVDEILASIGASTLLRTVSLVILSGGEPFLKQDFTRLVAGVLDLPDATVGILSNLYNCGVTRTRLAEIKTATGLQRVWIGTSLDGLERGHNDTRGASDAFEKFNETLGMLRAEFSEVPVTVNYTLTTDNYSELFETYRYCRERQLSMSVQFPVPWDDAETFSFRDGMMAEIEEQVMRVVEAEVKDHESGLIGESALMGKVFYLSGLLDYQRHPRRVFDKCVSGRRFAAVSPEGDVYFCPILKNSSVGNLRERPFDEIWAGIEARDLRGMVDAGACHCWLNCTIYPNINEALVSRPRDGANR